MFLCNKIVLQIIVLALLASALDIHPRLPLKYLHQIRTATQKTCNNWGVVVSVFSWNKNSIIVSHFKGGVVVEPLNCGVHVKISPPSPEDGDEATWKPTSVYVFLLGSMLAQVFASSVLRLDPFSPKAHAPWPARVQTTAQFNFFDQRET